MATILYSFRRCPYAIRARLALLVSKIEFELREIELKNKPKIMLTLSPKGTVPILHLDNGRVIDESLEIMLWSLQQSDPENWLPTCQLLKQQNLALIERNDNEFKPVLDRYKYWVRHPEKTQSEYRSDTEPFLKNLEQQLTQKPFLFYNKPKIADIAIFPFVRQFANVDLSWFNTAPYPKLRKWLNTFIETQLFSTAMTKHSTWVPN